MKKKLRILLISASLALIIGAGVTVPLLVANNHHSQERIKENISFDKSEYVIHSGEAVTCPGASSYAFFGKVPDNVSVDEKSGVISYSPDVQDNTQVLYVARNDERTTEPVVITLRQAVQTPSLSFANPISRICNGDYILGVSSVNSAISYALKDNPAGISIDQSTGEIAYTSAVKDGEEFTAVISSSGVSAEKAFAVASEHLVKVKNEKQAMENGKAYDVSYELDFSDYSGTPTVTGVLFNHRLLDQSLYSYDQASGVVKIKSGFAEDCTTGENTLYIITSGNSIKVTLIKADKFIRNAADLASINASPKALSGYYLLVNDLDLTPYLSNGGEGYDQGQGWKPIGTYHDVMDGTAKTDAFKGTFDGNGYTVSGLYMNRKDDFAFNGGLFGYVDNVATIRNLGVKGNGTSTVKSFCGGLAGVNEGIIENCWADVNLQTPALGDNAYHEIGGLTGRNSGEIRSSYALGKIVADSDVGAFCGLNEGTIVDCYATEEGNPVFSGGNNDGNNLLFSSRNSFMENIPDGLSAVNWNIVQGTMPSLRHVVRFFEPNSFRIAAPLTCNKGDKINVSADIYPEEFNENYKDKVSVTVDDSGCKVEGLTIDTSGAVSNLITITASLDCGNVTLNDSIQVKIEGELSEIPSDLSGKYYVEPGKRYRIINDDENGFTCRVTNGFRGVTVNDNILTVGESSEFSSTDEIELALDKTDGTSRTIVLTLRRPNYLKNQGAQVIYADDVHDLVFTMPDNVYLKDAELFNDDEKIDFTLNGHEVIIPSSYVISSPDEDVMFTLRLNDGSYYRLYGSYISHNAYKEENIGNEYYTIASAEDFEKYFNVTPEDYDAEKYNKYYDKTFVLTDDIDFAGKTLCSIGGNYEGVGKYFTGKVYGCGHTIRNAEIHDNETYFSLTDKDNPYRSSLYNVGFFSTFSGEIHDVTFSSIYVNGNNSLGILAGTITQNAVVENVTIKASEVTDIEGKHYSEGELTTGKLSAYCSGHVVGTTFNGSEINIIGENQK